MKKIVTLSKNFFKKNISSILSFSLILLISTLIFTSSFVVNNNISKDYDNKFEELNIANVFFIIPKIQYSDSIIQDIKKMDGVNIVETRNCIGVKSSFEMEDTHQDTAIIFYNVNDSSNLNKYKIIEGSIENETNSIYLTSYTYVRTYKGINDIYDFEINDKTYSYKIKAELEDMQYGYHTGTLAEYLSEDAYNQLLEDNAESEAVVISIKCDDSEKTYNEVSNYLRDKNIEIIDRKNETRLKYFALGVSDILVLILIAFSSIILIISLLVSMFKIGQSIEEEMTNMGILKAMGYISNEIIIANILPYIVSSIIFTIIGIGLSYLLIPLLGNVVMTQSGYVWNFKFDLKSDIIVLIINVVLVSLFTIISARKIKKLNPINAIRGLQNSKRTKNYFEIERTNGSIGLILMLKNFMNTKKQNLLLGIVLLLIAIIASFVSILYYNVNVYPYNFANTLTEESPSLIYKMKEDIKEELSKIDSIEKVIYYDTVKNIQYKDNTYDVFVAESFNNLRNDICYEGKNPDRNNEIAIRK